MINANLNINGARKGLAFPTAGLLLQFDGTILDDAGTKYFVDSKQGKNFLITNYDFPDDWTSGFPYKSAATISAPVGDAELIAADFNNFLYDSGGTPNQIPVVSLFQDIDYEHRFFCKHAAQILDGNGVETYEPRVLRWNFYSTVQADNNLIQCQNYFNVPTEDLTAKWVDGSVAVSGDGSKLSPWKTMSEAELSASDGDTLYVKTNIYTENGALNNLWLTKNIQWYSLGNCEIRQTSQTYTVLMTTSKNTSLNGFKINAQGVLSGLRFSTGTDNKIINRCYLYGALTTELEGLSTDNNTSLTINNCIINSTASTYGIRCDTPTKISGCYIKSSSLNYGIKQQSASGTGLERVEYCKFKGTFSTYAISFERANQYEVEIFNNTFDVTSTSSIFIYEQPSVEINYNIFSTLTSGNEIQINSNGVVCTKSYVKYNTLSHNVLDGYSIRFGTEVTGLGDNKLQDMQIIGNKIFGARYYSSSATPSKHGILIGFQNQNCKIQYNYINGCGINYLTKGSDSDYSNCVISYNISNNPYFNSLYHKGTKNTKAYNNTFIGGLQCIYFTENTGSDPAIGHELKNNIITTNSGYIYYFDASSYLGGENIDYNNIYIQDKLAFNGTAIMNLSQWNSAGFDQNSQSSNPLLTNNIPQTGSPAISNGTDLGATYKTGLDITTDWGDSDTIPNVVTKDQTSPWDIGAYVS